MRDQRFLIALVALLLALLAVNVVVSFRQQRRIRDLTHEVRLAREQSAPRRFDKGDQIDSLEVTDTAGAPRVLRARPQNQQLVVVVNPSCASCLVLAAELRDTPPKMPFWVLSVGDPASTTRFATEQRLSGVYALPPRANPSLRLRFRATPQVFVLTNGIVRRTCERVTGCA